MPVSRPQSDSSPPALPRKAPQRTAPFTAGADEVPPESALRPSIPAKPLLASEALMEDLAPVEPARGGARVWCAGLGTGFVLLGALHLTGISRGGPGAAVPSFVLGAIALVAALTQVSYRQRAVAMVALGLISGFLGLGGVGPAVGIGAGGTAWGVLRLLTAIALPSALIFRGRYRAYAGARWILAGAIAAALPFLGHSIASLFQGDWGLQQVGAIIAIGAILASLSGFMGSETTGAGSYTALGVALGLTVELALQALAAPGAFESLAGLGAVATTALAFMAISAIASMGLFQVLAWRFAADARRIDLHPAPKREPSMAESGDWSTRG